MAITITSLNANGCSSDKKCFSVAQYVSHWHSDVVFLQETNVKNKSSLSWRNWNYNIHHSFCNRLSGSGVLIAFKKSLDIKIVASDEYPEFVLYCKCVFPFNRVVHFINVYVPQCESTAVNVLVFIRKLCDNIAPDEGVVLGGDFNCTLYPVLDRSSGKEHRNGLVNRLQNLISSHGLIDVFRQYHPFAKSYTWFSNSQSLFTQARLDRIYVSGNLLSNFKSIRHWPCHFSDHNAIIGCFVLDHPIFKRTAYWKFLNHLLDTKDFVDEIENKLKDCVKIRHRFPSWYKWWINTKCEIKIFTSQYDHGVWIRKNQAHKDLTNLLSRLNRNDPEYEVVAHALDECCSNDFKRVVQSTIGSHSKLTAAPTKYLFSLSPKKDCTRFIYALRQRDGITTTNSSGIVRTLVDYHGSIYSQPLSIDQSSLEDFIKDLPTLSQNESDSLDLPMSAEEIRDGVRLMPRGKTPGIDGLSLEFYLKFWGILEPVLHRVYGEIQKEDSDVSGFSNSVVCLLPKKGDLTLPESWRPISLNNYDYKIYSKCLSIRLKRVLGSIIHPDQSYSVPGRSIHDNIHVIRDIVHLANVQNEDLALVKLDQEKAFDRVNHRYLFRTMEAFGFGRNFVRFIGTLYRQSTFSIRVNNRLSKFLPFENGIRQGCPLSGQLYSIAIEPFLCRLRSAFAVSRSDLLLREAESHKKVVISSYADDVVPLIRTIGEFEIVSECSRAYENISGAKLSEKKSDALWCGAWKNNQSTPNGYNWRNDYITVLGVKLGNTPDSLTRNHDDLEARVEKILAKWSIVKDTLSLRSRVIIVNQAIASALWHTIKVTYFPPLILRNFSRKFARFLWTNVHWVRRETVEKPSHQGGLGLVSMDLKLEAFRVGYLTGLYHAENTTPKAVVSRCLLRKYFDVVTVAELLLQKREVPKGVPLFYS